MKRERNGLSIFLTLIIVLTASMARCAATGTGSSAVLHKNADIDPLTPNYKYTFKPALVCIVPNAIHSNSILF